MNNDILHPTVMEVNINNFKHNINEIKKYIPPKTEIMPIMKAYAYGTYLNTRLDILNMFNIIGVSSVSEGIDLRNVGYKKDIFILNQPPINEINNILKYNLIVGVSSIDFINKLNGITKAIKIHVEIGTGMGRTGINPKRALSFINMIKQNKNIIIDGIYTHLSSADTDVDYTNKQLESFEKAINIIKENISTIRFIHSLASNGIINFPNVNCNLVRPGIIIYGYPSAHDTYQKINLKPVCTLKSRITFLKTVPKNTSIGYSRSYITNKKTKIATIPIGYADGMKRILSNKWHVLINGKPAPIIGNICMDSIMVDVTNIHNVSLNDEVYIWDNDKIKLEEIANVANTINYEIICTISNRVPRIFI